MKARLTAALIAGVLSPTLLIACGDSQPAVTVTKAETVTVATPTSTTLSPADQAWVQLIRQQANEMDEKSDEIRKAGVSDAALVTSALAMHSRLSRELQTTPTAGVSPCVAAAANDWSRVVRRWRAALDYALGAIPGSKDPFSDGNPLASQRDAVLTALNACEGPGDDIEADRPDPGANDTPLEGAAGFKTASGSAGCWVEADELTCVSSDSQVRSMQPTGIGSPGVISAAETASAADVAKLATYESLANGKSFDSGDFGCTVWAGEDTTPGIDCWNSSGELLHTE